jgi:hypothetical protein
MQEPRVGVTRGAERIVVVVPFNPSGLSASFSHVDCEQLWLYIYQGFADNKESVFEMGAGSDLYTQHEVNDVTPCNILQIKHWNKACA